MAKVTTPDVSNVAIQTMLDAGLNGFAVDLLVESYAKRQNPPPVAFVWRGVILQLRPVTVVAHPCTGVAARWCPNHGSCTSDPPEERSDAEKPWYSDHCSEHDCPLHGADSNHGDIRQDWDVDTIMRDSEVFTTWAHYDNVPIPSHDDARKLIAAIIRAAKVSTPHIEPTDEDVDHAVAAMRHEFGTKGMVTEEDAVRVALRADRNRRSRSG